MIRLNAPKPATLRLLAILGVLLVTAISTFERAPAADWQQSARKFSRPVFAMTVSSDTLYMITSDSLFASPASQEIWTGKSMLDILPTATQGYQLTAISVTQGRMLLGIRTAQGSGLVLTSVNGSAWKSSELPYDVTALGSGLGVDIAGTSNGLYRREGTTWNEIVPTTVVKDVVVMPSGNVFVATNSGIIRSLDIGAHFIGFGQQMTIVKIVALNEETFLAETAQGATILRSTNGGSAWDTVLSGTTNTFGVSLAVDSAGAAYSAASNFSSGKAVLLSADTGTTWKDIKQGVTDPIVSALASSLHFVFLGTAQGHVYKSEVTLPEPEKSVRRAIAVNSTVTVYPNPCASVTSMSFSAPHAERAHVRVLDERGATVLERDVNLTSGENHVALDVRGLSSGRYYYHLQSQSLKLSGKLVKR